jgi:hypothetical protein
VALDFPNSPAVGATYTVGNVTWVWDGSKWVMSATQSGPFLQLAGGTMAGPLVLNADPVVGPGAATKQYVDAQNANQNAAVAALPLAMNDNRIINGDMRIAQRGVSGGSATSGYTLDRWSQNGTPASLVNWAQGIGAGAPLGFGFEYWLGLQSITAHVLAAADYYQIYQTIEADMINDFAFGTPNAQAITLSFIAYSSLTGTFSGCITNGGATRSYPFTYSIPTANTWTKVAVTIPGDTAGTWILSGNGAALTVHFSLGSGATYSGPPNAWASANYVGATGSVAVIATNNAIWNVTGVKLEIGSVATPFRRESLTKILADCQRYFYRPSNPIYGSGYSPTAAGLSIFASRSFPTTMRASPTQSGATFSNSVNINAPSLAAISVDGVTWQATISTAGVAQLGVDAGTETYSAEL